MINTLEDNDTSPSHDVNGAMFQIMPQATKEDQQLSRRPDIINTLEDNVDNIRASND